MIHVLICQDAGQALARNASASPGHRRPQESQRRQIVATAIESFWGGSSSVPFAERRQVKLAGVPAKFQYTSDHS